MEERIRLLVINPGSTSTKIAVFENEEMVFSKDISHDAAELKKFPEILEQKPYREKMILNALEEAEISLNKISAFVGRGGGLMPCRAGTYEIGGILLEHSTAATKHPSTLGTIIANELAQQYGKKAYTVNPPDVDEFTEVARISGIKGCPRQSHFHALNQKEAGMRTAREMGQRYVDMNLIIAHVGGGISIAAHRKGRVVDCNDIIYGEGPMAPTRCGSMAVKDIIALCFSGEYTEREMLELTRKRGGLISHLDTSDVLEIKERIQKGDSYAGLVYEAMLYQIGKGIGSCGAVLEGQVDAIVLTGGIARDRDLVTYLKKMCGYLAPVKVYGGEFEMEALAHGVLRVLRGEEALQHYEEKGA